MTRYIHNASGALVYGGGKQNVLAVHVDALSYQEGWFYEGGGIYRHVSLVAQDPVSAVPWGVCVTKRGRFFLGFQKGTRACGWFS